MLRYQEFEHTADVGVEIYGKTLEELFKNAGYTLFEMIVDTTTIIPKISRTVSLTGTDTEMLLMNWLRELLYLFSVYQEVYVKFEILSGVQTSGVQTLVCQAEQNKFCTPTIEAIIKGELLDLAKHSVRKEIKAITYHQFAVTYEHGIWKARVIFDV
jgi:SHS2 domain-containing protein